MVKLRLLVAKFVGRILHSREPVNNYYRRGGGKNRKRMYDLFFSNDDGTQFNRDWG